ncbi:PspC domain-containing protein [Streptomyces pinistramenti]|uniref:PspC domain-containing protein n=1 Tax=Streptomyces pinistramenti TaxID=2884812 RepID=UPI001D06769D|nr:PspC domain-containing protein [Streptomyces pinistramenti]MCB5911186.1 PspC domain-containing protein [Streptomyces pinistramenti]
MNDAAPAEDPAPPGADGTTQPPAPLRRSRRHKVVAGVCGGLGRQWDLDPVIFRIVLAVLSVAGGLGLIVYGFAWLLIPLDGEDENEGRRLLSGRVEGSALTALLCALAGCGLFMTTVGKGSVMSFAIMLTLAVAGSAYWSRKRHAEGESPESMDAASAQAVADAPPETKAPPTPNAPSWWRDARLKGTPVGVDYLWGPEHPGIDITYESEHGSGAKAAGQRVPGPGDRGPAGRSDAPRRRPRAGRRIGGWTFLTALLAGTGTALAVARHDHFAQALQAGLACSLVVFGLALVLSAWVGRTGGGTVFMVVLTSVLLAVSTALPDTISPDWQNRHWTPTSISAVQRHYELGSGEGRLDLSALPVKDGRTVRTGAEVGAGRLEVRLPPQVAATVRISLGFGDVRLPGEAADDVHISAGARDLTVTLPANGLKKGERPRGSLVLELRVGVGQVDVRRTPPAPAAHPAAAPGLAPPSASNAGIPSATVPSGPHPGSATPAQQGGHP